MEKSLTAADNAFLARIYDDPVLFAESFLRIQPTEQQKSFLSGIAEYGARVSVRSGHGTGKTTCLAIAALWFLATREDALIPCTAPTASQLENILWKEIRRLIARMTPDTARLFKVTSDKVTMQGSNGFIVARTARPENPDALQGFHADNVLFIVEEASGVVNQVFEVARGALSTPNARVALAGNPTKLSGFFFDSHNANKDTWNRLAFSCLDSPLVDPNYPKEMADDYGADSDIYRVRVLGEFPKYGINAMVPADAVKRALNTVLPPGSVDYAPGKLGVDPAWEGTDRSVIFYRRGIFGKVLFIGRGLNGHELGSKVISFQESMEIHDTCVDKTGFGASCYDYLRMNGRHCTGISFAERASDERFINKRAEIWWRLREWVTGNVSLEPHPDLLGDLTAPEYWTTDRGQIQLESKESMRKRGIHSPDIGDALALTFAEPDRSVIGDASSAVRRSRKMREYHPHKW